jgi:hypothetical protein
VSAQFAIVIVSTQADRYVRGQGPIQAPLRLLPLIDLIRYSSKSRHGVTGVLPSLPFFPPRPRWTGGALHLHLLPRLGWLINICCRIGKTTLQQHNRDSFDARFYLFIGHFPSIGPAHVCVSRTREARSCAGPKKKGRRYLRHRNLIFPWSGALSPSRSRSRDLGRRRGLPSRHLMRCAGGAPESRGRQPSTNRGWLHSRRATGQRLGQTTNGQACVGRAASMRVWGVAPSN